MTESKQKLNVGVVGCGTISQFHFQSYEKNPDVIIYAVCDINKERAEEKAEQYNVENIYDNHEEMLQDPDLDAISICTWNNSHAEIAINALLAGKKVLVEKPLAFSLEEAEHIEEIVTKTNGHLQVGFVRRFAQNTNVLKKFIDSGKLGDIYYSKASVLRINGNPGGWFSDIDRSGGGPLIDIGVHVIDLCWYFMGRPKVKAIFGNVYRELGNRANIENYAHYQAADYSEDHNTVEDSANALIKFENGASLMVDVSFALHADKDSLSIDLFGTKGGAQLEPEFRISTEENDTIINILPTIDHPTFEMDSSFQAEIDHFVDSCLNDTETLAPVSDGVEIMKILSGIYESAKTGETITY